MAKLTTAQPKFTLLVANLTGGSDPSKGINPTKVRQGFVQQLQPQVSGPGVSVPSSGKTPGLRTFQGGLSYTVEGVPVACTGTVTVDDNTFTDRAYFYLGPYILTSDLDYAVGVDENATAANLAAAIDGLAEFSAVAAGPVITITGPAGLVGNHLRFESTYEGVVQNFILSTDTGLLEGAEPSLGPVEII